MAGYAARWWSRTWKEQKTFWSANRWLATIGSLLGGWVILALLQGLHTALNATQAILGGTAGIVLGFTLTTIGNALRAIKLLDDERASTERQMRETIVEQAATIADLQRPRRSQQEEHYYQEAKREVERLYQEQKRVLRYIILHDGIVSGQAVNVPLVNNERVWKILNQDQLAPLVRREDVEGRALGIRAAWKVVPGYQKAVSELLYGNEQL